MLIENLWCRLGCSPMAGTNSTDFPLLPDDAAAMIVGTLLSDISDERQAEVIDVIRRWAEAREVHIAEVYCVKD